MKIFKSFSGMLILVFFMLVFSPTADAITKLSKADAQKYLVSQVSAHETKISFYGKFDVDATSFFAKTILSRKGSSLNGVTSSEKTLGDYYYSSAIKSITSQKTTYGSNYCKYSYKITYRNSKDNEKKINTKISKIAKKIKASSDKAKVYAIADYVRKHMSYDKKKGSDKSLLPAINDKKGVCLHYSNMFYRIAKAKGLDVRCIRGCYKNEYHQWNIVKIGEKWYYVDCTLADSMKNKDAYVCMGANSSIYKNNYKADSEYRKKAWTSSHPIGPKNLSRY